MAEASSMVKRLFDVSFSCMALIFLSPFLLLIGFIVYVTHGKPVLFRQKRPGLRCGPFYMIKFRTMRDTVDSNGRPLSDEARLTPFGQFLRSTSLDELPELWNVFKGDMSLVGPRPLLMEYLPLYDKHQARRHQVRPGITGWAQVNGRNAITWEEKLKLDIWYVDNQSFWLDIKIILMTIKKVLTRDGINAEGEATMSKFTGNKQ